MHRPAPNIGSGSLNQNQQLHTNPWILIDSSAKKLTLYRTGHQDLVFENVAFGAAGVKDKIRRGDDVTPKGIYRVAWFADQSKFFKFIGLNYPSMEDAYRGLQNKVINQETFERIKRAHLMGKTPPQDTPLGGLIGIHGVGRGSLEIHKLANWTAGCVALDNNQIKVLIPLIKLGIDVEIR